ncbi:hypothetical protein [Streptomyces sp. NPDC001774]
MSYNTLIDAADRYQQARTTEQAATSKQEYQEARHEESKALTELADAFGEK